MDRITLNKESNNLIFIILWMAILLIFAYSWVPGGLDTDSCNYAVIAKEIVHSGKWLNLYDPIYQGPFYYHFPLCIWITALLFKLIGITTFAAKFFSMLSGVALAALLFYFGKLIKNNWVGFFASVSFLMTNHIVRLSRQCRMDIPVSFFIALAIFFFFLALRRSRLYYLLFGLSTCLAIMSKDVFGVFPLAIVLIYLLLRLRLKELFHPLFILSLVIAVAPVFVWIKLDNNMLYGNWFACNFMHLYKAANFNVPWYYYIWAIATKYFYFLPFALFGGYLAVKEAHKEKKFDLYLLIIWVLIFPLAFSFGRQKIHYFILPIYAATSLLVGFSLDRLLKEPIKIRIAKGLKYILVVASIIMLSFPLNIRSKRFEETVNLAPFVDELLKQAPKYEFIVYNQDKSAMLFYSQELYRAKTVADKLVLEGDLKSESKEPVFVYLSEGDFNSLDTKVKELCQPLLRYKDKIILVNKKDLGLMVRLPAKTLR